MNIFEIIIPVLFISIILKQLRYMKGLIIATRKRPIEVITILFGIMIIIGIMYFYANTWIHYIIVVVGLLMLLSIWIKQGINSKGFISMYTYKERIVWNEI